MSKSKLIMLRARAAELCDKMLDDPNRPFWQVEIVGILSDLADLMVAMETHTLEHVGDLTAVNKRLSSLETRYSDLLYRMSDKA